MTRTIARLVLICLAATISSPVRGDDPPKPKVVEETPGLLATQVSLALKRGRVEGRFRATVMAFKEDTLTVLTAAHCISEADKDGTAQLLVGGEVVEGKVLSVVRNPAYREKPDASGQVATRRRASLGSALLELPGPDNAVAQFRFKPSNSMAEDALKTIQPAPLLASRMYPGPGGQTVAVRMIDAHNVEHALKAGNYANPRWLQWGRSYQPSPGDSGGGVFLVQTAADGKPRPILIGIIVGYDDLGGGASLVARDQRWIAEALTR